MNTERSMLGPGIPTVFCKTVGNEKKKKKKKKGRKNEERKKGERKKEEWREEQKKKRGTWFPVIYWFDFLIIKKKFIKENREGEKWKKQKTPLTAFFFLLLFPFLSLLVRMGTETLRMDKVPCEISAHNHNDHYRRP